jgi:hypothetical protein
VSTALTPLPALTICMSARLGACQPDWRLVTFVCDQLLRRFVTLP